MYVPSWLNTVAAVEMIFIEHIFVFFITLFLKRMGIMLSTSKPHCHSRQFKQYALNTFFRLIHAPKFQIFSTKLNLVIKVVKLFAGILWKSRSHEFYRKTPMQESLYQIFQNAFFAKHIRVTTSAKYPFLFVTWTSATKNVSFNLCYFTSLRAVLCRGPRQTLAVTKLIYC